MNSIKRNQALAWGVLITIVSLTWIWGLFGGKGLIRGVGNSGNQFNLTPPAGKLPDLIAASATLPEITDEQLTQSFEAVLASALDGDLEAAAILFEAAEKQRHNPDL